MNNILNKVIIFISLSILTITIVGSRMGIFILLIALALSSFLEYFDNDRISFYGFAGYLILSIFIPEFLYLLPLIFYNLIFTKYNFFSILSAIPLIININTISIKVILILIMISILEVILKKRCLKEQELFTKYIRQRDDFKETSIQLENKIRELTIKQDTEVNLATLNERNRIAREIHDTVGHLLSSSIIQIGAVMATTKEENTKENLNTVKKTLDTGMNSIRNSIHNIHDDSIDLYSQVNTLIDNFNFCTAKLNYEVETNIDIKIKYAIISIIKEALANVIKHSNSDTVTVSIKEHPKLIQLVIVDNGNKIKTDLGNGMGLESIKQRATALNGIINFDSTNGFRIFISFPKINKEDN